MRYYEIILKITGKMIFQIEIELLLILLGNSNFQCVEI